jgi:GNAT superfamily N-acetyltransferase
MVRFSVCGPPDVDDVVSMLATAFAEGDPPTVAAGVTADEFGRLVELYRGKAGADGLSVIARSATTGELAGALLAEDSAAPFPEGAARLSPKFDPIFDILGELEGAYRPGRGISTGTSLHLFLLGVKQPFTRQRVAQGLVRTCIEVGARRGYRLAVTEATSSVSQHIFRKLGFVDRVRRSYRDYRFRGRAVFSSITDHEGPVLLDRTLT